MNSDWDIYNGSNHKNVGHIMVEDYNQDNQNHSILVNIPPLGIIFLKAHYKETKKEDKTPKEKTKKITRKKVSK